MLTFEFSATTLVPKMVGYVKVTAAAGAIDSVETKDFRCFFNDFVAKSCTYITATNSWMIYAPRLNDLFGVYVLTI